MMSSVMKNYINHGGTETRRARRRPGISLGLNRFLCNGNTHALRLRRRVRSIFAQGDRSWRHRSAKNSAKLVILRERERMRVRVEGSMYFAKGSSRPEDVGKSEKKQTGHAASLPQCVNIASKRSNNCFRNRPSISAGSLPLKISILCNHCRNSGAGFRLNSLRTASAS
jgi:hypothetical protein